MEEVLVLIIDGQCDVPPEMVEDVAWYRAYAAERGECVSYPRWKDAAANAVFDRMLLQLQFS
jgi:hypothetical protein